MNFEHMNRLEAEKRVLDKSKAAIKEHIAGILKELEIISFLEVNIKAWACLNRAVKDLNNWLDKL